MATQAQSAAAALQGWPFISREHRPITDLSQFPPQSKGAPAPEFDYDDPERKRASARAFAALVPLLTH